MNTNSKIIVPNDTSKEDLKNIFDALKKMYNSGEVMDVKAETFYHTGYKSHYLTISWAEFVDGHMEVQEATVDLKDATSRFYMNNLVAQFGEWKRSLVNE